LVVFDAICRSAFEDPERPEPLGCSRWPGAAFAWYRNPSRISADIPPMHFGRVKPIVQLHAPRVRCVYIKPIPDTCKCLKSVLPAKRPLPEPSNRPVNGYVDNSRP